MNGEPHEHAYVHDEHHQHIRDGPVIEPHSHWHRHQPHGIITSTIPTSITGTGTDERSVPS